MQIEPELETTFNGFSTLTEYDKVSIYYKDIEDYIRYFLYNWLVPSCSVSLSPTADHDATIRHSSATMATKQAQANRQYLSILHVE